MFNASTLSRVPLTKNPNFKRDPLKAYGKLLQKYNIEPTLEGPFAMADDVEQSGSQAVLRPNSKMSTGPTRGKPRTLIMKDAAGKHRTVPAQSVEHDSEYLAKVEIGSPAQTMKLDFDTGSADLWCWSSHLPEKIREEGKNTGHSIFDIEKSSTFKKLDGSYWNITYGDGSSASGDVGTDTLTLGGLSVQRQAIETAIKLSPEFLKNISDGLLGLAFGQINTVKPVAVKTPVENMIIQEDIPKNAKLFTAYLGSFRDKQNPNKGESFYTFGYIDTDVVKASKTEINYVPVNTQYGFWQISSPSATVNGKVIDRTGNEAVIDTGTTLALVDDKLLETIYGAIPGARKDDKLQGWLFPTSIPISRLPTVQFAVGSKLFTVLPEDLQYVQATKDEWYGGMQSRGKLPFDILGDTFLKNIYGIFDLGNKRFGCVQRFEPGEMYPNSSVPASGSQDYGDSRSWIDWFKQLMGTLAGWLGIK